MKTKTNRVLQKHLRHLLTLFLCLFLFATSKAQISNVVTEKWNDFSGQLSEQRAAKVSPAKVASAKLAGTDFIESFTANLLPGWYFASYGVTLQNQALKIIPLKASVWDGFGFSFPEISIKNAPFVSLKIKSNFDFNISMAVGKKNGKIDNYPLRPTTIAQAGAQEIVASNDFQEYSFDYTGLSANALDSVSNVHFVLNPLTSDFGKTPNKEIYFDDIKIGDAAAHTPAISNIQDQVFSIKAAGTASRTVNFRNVTDGSTNSNLITITATSSNPACIPNPTVIYTSPKSTGSILLQPIVSAIGESVISVVVSAPNTTNKVMTFKVKVVPNAAPSMQSLPGMVVKKGEKVTVALDNIFDGNAESVQTIALTGKSSNALIIPAIEIKHDSTDFAGTLSFTPAVNTPTGTNSTVSVKLKDNGGVNSGGIDSASYSFNVAIYDEINHKPTFDSISPKSVKALPGSYHLDLTGLNDGDNNTQNLSFVVTASTDSVITNLSVGSIINGVAPLNYNLTGKTGTTSITVKVTDDGAKTTNNGNQTIIRSFIVTSVASAVTGIIANYTPFIGNVMASGVSNEQGEGVVEIMADGIVHMSGNIMPQTWPSVNFAIAPLTGGKELDLSANKYVSFKFKGASTNRNITTNKPLDATTIVFRLVDNIIPNTPGSGYAISAINLSIPNDDAWHDMYLDFNGLFKKDLTGGQTDSTRIIRLMLDVNCTWFQQIKGDYYFKDLKVGDQADRPLPKPYPTVNSISNQVIYKGQTAKPILLTGITNGTGKQTASLTATTNKPNLITGLNIGAVVNGTALLSYTINTGVADSAKVTVIADNKAALNAVPDTTAFMVYVVDTVTVGNNTVNIDFSKTYQTMAGMGTMLINSNDPIQIQQVKDLNITLMRFTSTGEFEPTNDNADPNVTNFANYNREALPTAMIRNINENTNCHTFFYTPWSPANWMKQNKGLYPDPATLWAPNNKLKPEMYEEFAEYLVAICKTVKEEAGVELYAISLQNEPTFNEPYPSCQYTGAEFRDLIKIVGPRLKAENLNTLIMLSEDVAMNNWVQNNVNPTIADAEAKKYLGIVACHNYDPDGIKAGSVGSRAWSDLLTLKNTTLAKGLWMTETSGFGNVWEGYTGKDYLSGNPQFFPGPLDFAGCIFTAFKSGNISGWTDFEGTGFKTANDLSGSVFKNYSAYVNPGSVMVDAISSNANILSLAFKNADNSVTAILLNKGKTPMKVALKGQNVPRVYRSFTTQNFAPFMEGAIVTNGSIVLPPRSITTLYHTDGNLAPQINQLGNMFVELAKGDSSITLNGIGYGPDVAQQSVTSVTASSANPAIATASVTYTANGATAVLRISPVAFGTALVTVKVKDNGGRASGGIDSTLMKFYVNVASGLNHAPTINAVAPVSILEDADSVRVNLTGISGGDLSTEQLQFTVTSSNALLIANPRISYTTGSPSAELVFKPLANANGTANLSIVVTDNGGNADNNGNMMTKLDIATTVTAVNDAPVITANVISAPIKITALKKFPITVSDGDSEADQTVIYVVSNSNPAVASATVIDNLNNTFTLNVRGLTGGVANIKFMIKDNGGIQNAGVDSASVVYAVTVIGTGTGIDEATNGTISLFPNPAEDYVMVTLDNNEFPEGVVITDAYGRLVLKEKVANESNKFKLSISTFLKGLYFITVNSTTQSHTLKFIRR